jgi:hypothetical protein
MYGKGCLPSDYKPGTLLKLSYAPEFKGEHWVVEVTPDSFRGIANNRGYSLSGASASTSALYGEAITRAKVIKRSGLLLCLDRTVWTLEENFERFFK